MEHAKDRLKALSSHLVATQSSHGVPATEKGSTNSCSAPVVLGAMVMDIQAQATDRGIEPGGTVPGIVQQVPGGVGRNVAQALAQLCRGRTQPLLLSVIGDDSAGAALLTHWASLDLPVHGIVTQSGTPTPAVVYCFDRDGSVAAGIAAVASLESSFTPALVRGFRRELTAAPLIILDGNLPAIAIEEVCRCARAGKARIWFEPVSSAKSVRATEVLHDLAFISPNAAELVAMSNEVQRRKQLPALLSTDGAIDGLPAQQLLQLLSPRIQTLLEAGVGNVLLTLGAQGAALCCKSSGGSALQVHLMPALPAEVQNTSGAGDCLVAGACMRLLEGGDAVSTLACGMAAAQCAVQSKDNVPLALSSERVRTLGRAAQATLRSWEMQCAI